MGVATLLWRAFDKTVRRKPLAFAADAVYGNSIDLELEVIAKKGLVRKALLLMLVNSTAPRIHAGHGTPQLFFFQAKIRLHLYTRQRPPRKRLRSDGQTGSYPEMRFWETCRGASSAQNCQSKESNRWGGPAGTAVRSERL